MIQGVTRIPYFIRLFIDVYQRIALVPKDASARLTAAIVASPAGQSINFEGIQQTLKEKACELLGVEADFTKTYDGEEATKPLIDKKMGFDVSDTPITAIEPCGCPYWILCPNPI